MATVPLPSARTVTNGSISTPSVHPAKGAAEWWVANSVNVFQGILDPFARESGAGPDKTVVLLLDNAGWHHGPC
ncbi:hypothetical protein [Pararhodospirillum oryzae]|uniref:Tc1-like transposase DDE domain-containing protein n=1 Tax=Pararhodospirillum oryzae TaxID=478448 RepID=A0A512HA30_9PROT|nr:hypothetical protein [Pararhodospirillum oryzae]GEO82313.1 hypothetical protein ROR02_24440 [Pararhodospirillum oryzae]